MMSSKMRPGLLVWMGGNVGPVEVEPGAQIGAAVIAEAGDGLAGAGVDGGEESAR